MKKEYVYTSGQKCSEVRDKALAVLSPRLLDSSERPREKLMDFGPASLSDLELLSIMLVSGVQGRNVTEMAGELLEYLDRKKDIPSVEQLSGLMGIGQSKACSIAAMLEFGRRRWASGQKIRTPNDTFQLIRHHADRRQERFICISLNGAHEVLAVRIVTIGLVNRTIVHPREVFSDPILDRASAIIVAHNHPSGEAAPSGEDDEVTNRLKAAADILGIHFLDHLIFTENFWYSYSQSEHAKYNEKILY